MTFPLPSQPRRRWPLRVVRVEDPRPALELVRRDGSGWFLCPLRARKENNR